MQSQPTAQSCAANVALKQFGEHINHTAANSVIGWPEAQHYDHHSANIEARAIEQTDRIQTVGAQWYSGATNCCRGGGNVFFIMFNTRHALPLPGVGLGVREGVAVVTRHVREKTMVCVRGLGLSTSLFRQRTGHGHELSMSANCP